ncbi:hypothetical protein [Nocardia sienata]|uniref:hypothetical protein n=1 Tax=Nocardia sienata TaxID=248552 RepID=UPI00157CE912|nr:hypothetical protein [Nocardia sienata]
MTGAKGTSDRRSAAGWPSAGVLLVDVEFELGQVLFTEFEHYHPLEQFLQAGVPALIVHGDRDTPVSYRLAAEPARARPATELVTIASSDHGFDTEGRESEAITTTAERLTERSARSARRPLILSESFRRSRCEPALRVQIRSSCVSR